MIIDDFKRNFKKMVAFFVFYSGTYHILGWLTEKICREKNLYVFLYHRIGRETDDFYEHNITVKYRDLIDQLAFFKKKFQMIKMSEAVELIKSEGKLTRDVAVITFDDGYQDNFTYGLDLFRENSIHPIIYLTAGAIDSQRALWTEVIDFYMLDDRYRTEVLAYFGFSTDFKLQTKREIFVCAERIKAQLKKLPMLEILTLLDILAEKTGIKGGTIPCQLMGWSEIMALADAGCELGNHTLHHVNLAAESAANAAREISESAALIKKRTGCSAEHFAYPYGKNEHLNPAICEYVKMHCQSAVTVQPGINSIGHPTYLLKRIPFNNHQTIPEIKVKLLFLKLKNQFSRRT